MSNSIASPPSLNTTPALEDFADLVQDDLVERLEPAQDAHAGRGIFTGMLLSAVLWGAILLLTGVIKL